MEDTHLSLLFLAPLSSTSSLWPEDLHHVQPWTCSFLGQLCRPTNFEHLGCCPAVHPLCFGLSDLTCWKQLSRSGQQWDHHLSALYVFLSEWACLVPSCRRRLSRHQSSWGALQWSSSMVWDLLHLRWFLEAFNLILDTSLRIWNGIRRCLCTTCGTDWSLCNLIFLSLFLPMDPSNRAGNSLEMVFEPVWREKWINCICSAVTLISRLSLDRT